MAGIVNTRIVKVIMQRPVTFLIFILTTNERIDLRILAICECIHFKTPLNVLPGVGLVRRLLYQSKQWSSL